MGIQGSQNKTIRSQLVSAMRDGEYAACDHLPRENVLAETLGISRTQLRDILASLEREGFITRRHGVGTVTNHHVLAVETRMDIEVEFLDMIRQSGKQPAIHSVRACEDRADVHIASQLGIEVGAGIVRAERICTADGKPAIYCEDVFATALVKGPYTLADLELPIFHFLQRFCNVYPYLDLTEIRPAVADARLALLLEVPEGTPLLKMEEVDYDIDGKPVLSCTEYFVDGMFHHTVLRKKL